MRVSICRTFMKGCFIARALGAFPEVLRCWIRLALLCHFNIQLAGMYFCMNCDVINFLLTEWNAVSLLLRVHLWT